MSRIPSSIAVIFLFAIASCIGVFVPGARAANYPDKPIRVMVVYPPGGGIDILARPLGQRLTDTWGVPLVIDNRPGAGTTIASGIVAKAAPDDYTLLMSDVSFVIVPSLYTHLSYDPVRAFTPVSLLNSVTDMLVVYPSLPVNSVKELIEFAKANPRKILYASAGNGTPPHLAAELFKAATGVDMIHVPYKGAVPALVDVLAGQCQLWIGALASPLPYVRAGRLPALAVTGKARSNLLPNVPTMAEAGLPDYDVSSWYALLAPAGTPRSIVEKISQEAGRAVQTPVIKQQLASDGAEAIGSSPQEFALFLKNELSKWGKAVKLAGAKLD